MGKYSPYPGDKIPAILEDGEYVLNRNAVNAIGKEKLDVINKQEHPRFLDSNKSLKTQNHFKLGLARKMADGGIATVNAQKQRNLRIQEDMAKGAPPSNQSAYTIPPHNQFGQYPEGRFNNSETDSLYNAAFDSSEAAYIADNYDDFVEGPEELDKRNMRHYALPEQNPNDRYISDREAAYRGFGSDRPTDLYASTNQESPRREVKSYQEEQINDAESELMGFGEDPSVEYLSNLKSAPKNAFDVRSLGQPEQPRSNQNDSPFFFLDSKDEGDYRSKENPNYMGRVQSAYVNRNTADTMPYDTKREEGRDSTNAQQAGEYEFDRSRMDKLKLEGRKLKRRYAPKKILRSVKKIPSKLKDAEKSIKGKTNRFKLKLGESGLLKSFKAGYKGKKNSTTSSTKSKPDITSKSKVKKKKSEVIKAKVNNNIVKKKAPKKMLKNYGDDKPGSKLPKNMETVDDRDWLTKTYLDPIAKRRKENIRKRNLKVVRSKLAKGSINGASGGNKYIPTYQKGGSVEGMKRPGGYSIGTPNIEKRMMQNLKKIQSDKTTKDLLKKRTKGDAKLYREHIKVRERDGSLLTNKEVQSTLRYFANKTRPKKMQEGGMVNSTGGEMNGVQIDSRRLLNMANKRRKNVRS